jgi:MoxR-vWA-beta-propeller ternary system domain bpX2
VTGETDPWVRVSAARLPAGEVAALGPVRHDPDVRVHLDTDRAWVRWPAGRADVIRCLVPVSGVVFFSKRSDGGWSRFGSRLPTADGPPDESGEPLVRVMFPARLDPIPPGEKPFPPLGLRLVRGGQPQTVTGAVTSLDQLAAWADTATTLALSAIRAARCGRRVLLVGSKVPPIPGSTRFWGSDLLLPVGFRTEPVLPPSIVRTAVGATADDLAQFDESGVDLVPRSAFEPLTRAGVRLAVREAIP